MNGFLIANKPAGMTSSDMVVFVRRRLPKGTAVGHGGTLDPDASGVLPICIGSATRLFDYIIDKTKSYVAELQLGVETDTQDASGSIVRECPVNIGENELRELLPRFTGEIEQIPPMYSALKRDGVRLYQLARKGESVKLEPRKVRVENIELLGASGEHRYRLRVDCGKGVYIRTLCHDIGRALGCGGHMVSLCRTRAGVFDINHALTPVQIDEAARTGTLNEKLLPLDAPLGQLPAVQLGEAARHALINGNPIRARWLNEPVPLCGFVRLYLNGHFAGIGISQADGSIRIKAMLLPESERRQA